MLSRSEVQSRLAPHHDLLVDAHLGAAARIKKVMEGCPELIAALDATERANLIHGQVRDLVTVAVEGMHGIKTTSWSVFSLAVGPNLLVRFRYVGRRGAPVNAPTGQQKLLARQTYKEEAMAVLALAGITEPPTTVTCGYTLEGLDIGRVVIRRDCGGHEPWVYSLYGEAVDYEHMTLPGTTEAKPAVLRSKIRPAGTEETGLENG
jgi:hypothetical protein